MEMKAMRRAAILIAGIFLFAPSAARAYLDQEAIHALYQEGSFEVVIRSLERYMQANPGCPREDSIFIAKHLAVVYAANPATVEKGKFWMNRLLTLLPAASLLDMYVSEEIDRIFDKVRKEFLERQRLFGVETNGLALPERPQKKTAAAPEPAVPAAKSAAPTRGENPVPGSGKSGGGWWKPAVIAGGVVLAAGGAYAFFTLREDPKTEVRRVSVPRRDTP
jgi:hypothetical protein